MLDPITVVGYLGGPENPWADAAGVVVAAADVLGFSSLFGGGGPTLSPSQQAAVHHGISLTTTLPETVVTAPQLTSGFLQGFASAGGSFLFGNDATLAVTTEPSSDPNTLDQIDLNGVRYGMHGFDPIPFVPGGGALECIIMHCSGGGWALAGIGAIPFASIEGGIASAGQHLVLGLRAYGLEQTALKVGGQTLLKDPNWKASLVNALTNGSTKITVSVEGLNGSSVYSQVMQAVQKGLGAFPSPTNWELAQLYQAGRLATTTFVDGLGNILPNPF